MNANNIYILGSEHSVCEDYSLSGIKDNVAYAVVCDGCSASIDVDLGARILALSSREALFYFSRFGTRFDSLAFGTYCIDGADECLDNFPLVNRHSLDCTLLIAWVKDKKLTAYLYGDGVIIHRHKNGVDYNHVTISSGAPDYLSYFLDLSRKSEYDKIENNEKIIENNSGKNVLIPFVPVVWEGDVEEGDIISVISDGINSFSKADSTPIDWKDLIDEFTLYKNFSGDFVMRRIMAFKRKCLKEGITHYDDISVASVVV